MGAEGRKTENQKGHLGGTVVCWLFTLVITGQRHRRGSQTWEKRKVQNSKYGFYGIRIAFKLL